MKRIESQGAVIVESRSVGEASAELPNAVLAFVKNRTAKERLPRDIERDFRQPLGRIKKIVCLKTPERGDGVGRIPLRYRDDVVGLRIDLEFALEEVLEEIGITQLGNVRDPRDVVGEFRATLKRNAVTAF